MKMTDSIASRDVPARLTSSSSSKRSVDLISQLIHAVRTPHLSILSTSHHQKTVAFRSFSSLTVPAITKIPSFSWKWVTLAAAAACLSGTALEGEVQADEEVSEDEAENKLREAVQKQMSDGSPAIYRIVLTGGPCGGKSTSLSLVSDRLRSLGFIVFAVPEASTMIITGGGKWKSFADMTPDQSMAFEGNLMRTKIALEDAFYAIAKATNEPCVILCDRGTMDTAAYVPKESWEVLLDTFNWNMMNLRDRRYDAVLHLVTSAIGAEKYYTTENNAARMETIDQARALDFKVLNAWVGHPNIYIFDNSTDFQGKVKRVITQVCQVVGAPKPVDYKRKFVLDSSAKDAIIPVVYEQFEVEQTYLLNSKGGQDKTGYTYIRRRGQNGSYHYSHSTLAGIPMEEAQRESIDKRTVLERHISGREYVTLLKQSDPNRITVRKRVKCFIWNNQYFQLSTFLEPNISLTVLETEVAEDNRHRVEIPEWLEAKYEVTGDERFSSFKISKIGRGPSKLHQAKLRRSMNQQG
ncbi:hypothetical protein PROFUN_03481 [Planoprotostelium fungivorum]|uniref:NadR/Ttd14 AAA domain-containing protein n=1 Tax=Planoprotostelium fungivorum TaxID=1890364 RepID=A0A2P6MN92_9EUKA|nr:hypothetical protein PROFUN_03481 [Planoprotostelium fungivorum]